MDSPVLSRSSHSGIDVYFVLFDHGLVLDWAGPAEAFRIANQACLRLGWMAPFALHFVGPRAEVTSSVGAQLAHIQPLPNLLEPKRPAWVVLIGQVGACVTLDTAPARELLHWLGQLPLRQDHVELVCICAGAVIAAHAGLLDGRHVTTHHHHLEELRRVAPKAHVLANRVFVQDKAVYSSAGVTTGIDLSLHRIAQVLGPVLAAQVAQSMVVALRRGPEDPELSPFLRHRHHLNAVVHRVQDAVTQAPHKAWTIQAMADIGYTSPRHLSRLFETHAGVTPSHYLQSVRLAVAQAAVRSGQNISQAAACAGFGSDAQLRRTWARHGLPGTPRQSRSTPHPPTPNTKHSRQS